MASIEIALTFDEGPDGTPGSAATNHPKRYNTTERILRYLESPGEAWPEPIKAAFFVQTHAAGRMDTPYGKALVQRAHAAGHVIGIHSGAARDREDHVIQSKAGTLTANLQQAKVALTALNLPAPEFVRGPAGLRNPNVDQTYTGKNLDYVFWDIDSFDFTRQGSTDPWIDTWLTQQIRNHVKSIRGTDQRRALVVRFHDTSFFTAVWLPRFIEAIVAGGAPVKRSDRAVAIRFCRTRGEVEAILRGSTVTRGDDNALKPYEIINGTDQGDEPVLLHWILRAFEGSVGHLYLDSKGKVTVGVGHHVEKMEDMDTIEMVDATGTPADSVKKREEWASIKALPSGENIPAKSFRNAGKHKLSITPEKVAKLLCEEDRQSRGIEVAQKVFTDVFPDVDAYALAPLPARIALVDMAFNLGEPKLKSKFVEAPRKFGAHVAARRWSGKPAAMEAAEECKRTPPVPAGRNEFTEHLLEAAQVLDHSPVIQASLRPPLGKISGTSVHVAIPLELVLEPGWTLASPFEVTPTLEWREHGRTDTVTLPVQSATTTSFKLAIPADILQGGIVRVKVGRLSLKKTGPPLPDIEFTQLGRVLAANPTKSTVTATLGALAKPPIEDTSGSIDLGIAYRSIAYHATTTAPGAATANAYQLFNIDGAPIFQEDGFFGLLRLPSATAGPQDGSLFWDWQKQIAKAETRLVSIEAAVARAIAAARARAGGAIALTPVERLTECLQRWGTNRDDSPTLTYWKWSAKKTAWLPMASGPTYASKVLAIYKAANSTNPPPNF